MSLAARLFVVVCLLGWGGALAADVEPQHVNHSGVRGLLPRESSEVSLVMLEDSVGVAFTGMTGVDGAIYYRTFSRTAKTWTDPQLVSGTVKGLSYRPKLTEDRQGNLHLVWLFKKAKREYFVGYSRLDTGASNWMEPVRFPAGKFRTDPKIAFDSKNRVYICYSVRDRTDPWGRIAVRVSSDGGSSWQESDPNFAADAKKGAATNPVLAGNGEGLVFAVWLDQSVGGREVVFNATDDGGATWLPKPVDLSRDPRFSYSQPRVLYADGAIYVFWSVELLADPGRQSELWTSRSGDLGRSWTEPKRVFSRHVRDVTFEPFLSGDNIGCVWAEMTQEGGGGALLETDVWSGGQFVQGESRMLRTTDDETHFQNLRLVSSNGRLAVFVAEQSVNASARIIGLFREEAATEWQARVINEPKNSLDALGVEAVFDPTGSLYDVVFHEVRRRRLIPEPEIWDTNIVFLQLPLNAQPGPTR